MRIERFTVVDDSGQEFEAVSTRSAMPGRNLPGQSKPVEYGPPSFSIGSQHLNLQRDGSFIGVLDGKRYRLKGAA